MESCTLVINEKAPAVIGAPEMIPVVEFRIRPGGSSPLGMLQE
jgi:hypothetical protein